MGRVEDLAERYERHIGTPWMPNLAGPQKVVFLVYDKTDERRLRARQQLFQLATKRTQHDWREFDLTDVFPSWLAADEYREAYFRCPQDLTKVAPDEEGADFTLHAAACLRSELTATGVTENTVLGVFGTGTLLGLARLSLVLRHVERDIRGRLLVFFPGSHEHNNYRLLDARDGWNYLAVPITLHQGGPEA